MGEATDDVDSVIRRVLNQLIDEATESRKIGGDTWDSEESTFRRSISTRTPSQQQHTSRGRERQEGERGKRERRTHPQGS